MKTIRDEIIEKLQEVFDPEISINVYDLGLIYDIQIDEENRAVEITHTLTSAFCGFADHIADEIRQAGYVSGIESVEVITTFDPPFSMEMVPEATRLALGWV